MSKNGGLDEHEAAYIGAFAGEYRSESRLAKAYEVALDIRKFEIDLYWKRSASFWLLVGGISAMLGFLVGFYPDFADS
jgi:hypothetical protein